MASSSAPGGKCAFCRNAARYTCPRCNFAYCSSSCYKHASHARCSESFYKDMVEAELRSGTVSEESRKKMLEILRRVEAGESILPDNVDEPLDSDDEDDDDLAVRMADIDLNDSEAVWKKLTEKERQEFRQLVNSGSFDDLLPPWSPWWEQEVPPVQEISPGHQIVPAYVAKCPPLVDVPLLSQVMKGSPSPTVPFNILNVLSGYAWTVRLFNGDHQESSVDATEALLSLSSVLSANANFEEAAIAVDSPKMEAQNHPWLMESEEFAGTVRRDVMKMLKGPSASDQTFYVRAALSEIHVLLSTCKASLSKKKKSGTRKGLFTSSFGEASQHVELKITTLPLVKSSLKKVEFLLSFVREYAPAIISLTPT
ncbi:zinc finger HIT domain-containing protein 2-like [Penaeus indicus]|uniref:zinc finger HIT domain-containing protein 2-like n=1 Tax=Penaeus indicus TaxID=29960 RepID=UPI00300D4CB8